VQLFQDYSIRIKGVWLPQEQGLSKEFEEKLKIGLANISHGIYNHVNRTRHAS
jgi:hypothetical protein